MIFALAFKEKNLIKKTNNEHQKTKEYTLCEKHL
jgi:hypothetical protein